MHTRPTHLPPALRLLLFAFAALLLVGVPLPAAAAPVNANDELKVARDAYDVLLKDLWKEPDTEAMLTAAYDAAQKSLNVTGQPLRLTGSANTQWNTFADGVRGLVRQANADQPEATLRAVMIRAMAGVVNDEHTYYLPRQMYERSRAEVRGELSIVNYGFVRLAVGDDVYFRSVVPGGNVERAGGRIGDQILALDGEKVTAANANDLFANPMEGSTRVFTVRRAGTAQPVDLTVTVRKYDRSTVSYRVLDGDIGYIAITTFLDETPGRIDTALAEFARQGVNSLVVDVRGNPGGLARATERVMGRFLPNGTVTGSNDGRSIPRTNSVARSEGKTPTTWPIVVLTDAGSGSASEYLALAVRDFRDATLVGTKTAGALGAALARRLSDGSGLEVTLAVYTTANGEQLNGVGITPNVIVPNATNDDIIAGRDPQLDQAIAQANVKAQRRTAAVVALPVASPASLPIAA